MDTLREGIGCWKVPKLKYKLLPLNWIRKTSRNSVIYMS